MGTLINIIVGLVLAGAFLYLVNNTFTFLPIWIKQTINVIVGVFVFFFVLNQFGLFTGWRSLQ